MFKRKIMESGSDTAGRIQQNVSNLPLTSMALVGLVGAGAIALVARMHKHSKDDDMKGI